MSNSTLLFSRTFNHGADGASLIRVSEEEQYHNQTNLWASLLTDVSEWITTRGTLISKAQQLLSDYSSQEQQIADENIWASDGFCGLLSNHGDQAYIKCRPLLLTNAGRQALHDPPSRSPLVTKKDLKRLKLYTQKAIDDALKPPALIAKGQSPRERLISGDCFRHIPLQLSDMYGSLLKLDNDDIRVLILLGLLYLVSSLSSDEGGTWESAFAGCATFIREGTPFSAPLHLGALERSAPFQPVSDTGVYTDLGCSSIFETDEKYNDRMLFIVSEGRLRLTSYTRTNLDFDRMWSCCSCALDLLTYCEVEARYGLDSLSLRSDCLRYVWNHGAKGTKKLNSAITDALMQCHNLIVPIAYVNDTIYVPGGGGNPILKQDSRLYLGDQELSIRWQRMSNTVRTQVAPTGFSDAVSRLNDLGLSSWATVLSDIHNRKLIARADICCVFNEPMQWVGYSYSDVNYEMALTQAPDDITANPHNPDLAFFSEMSNCIVAEAVTLGMDYRQGLDLLTRHMTTSRSAGGAKVKMLLDSTTASTLGYQSKKPVSVSTTGKAVVTATIASQMEYVEEMTKFGTYDTPFLVSTRTVPLRNTRTTFMVPTPLQLALGPLYEASGALMRRQFSVWDATFPEGSFVPALAARTDLEKGAAIMLGASASASCAPYTCLVSDFHGQDRHSYLTVHALIKALSTHDTTPLWSVRSKSGDGNSPWTKIAAEALTSACDSWYALSRFNPGSDGTPLSFRVRSHTLTFSDIPQNRVRILANPSGVWVTERMNSMVTATALRHATEWIKVNGDDSYCLTSQMSAEAVIESVVESAKNLGQDLSYSDVGVEFGSFLRILYPGMAMIRRHMSIDAETPSQGSTPLSCRSLLDKAAKMCRRGDGNLQAYSILRSLIISSSRVIRKFGYVYTAPSNFYAWPSPYPGEVGAFPCTANVFALLDHVDIWMSLNGMTTPTMEIVRPEQASRADSSLARSLVGLDDTVDISGVSFVGKGLGGGVEVTLRGDEIRQNMEYTLTRSLDPIRLGLSNTALVGVTSALGSSPLMRTLKDVQYKNSVLRQTSSVLSTALKDKRITDTLAERIYADPDSYVFKDTLSAPSTAPYVLQFSPIGDITIIDDARTRLSLSLTLGALTHDFVVERVGHYDLFLPERVFMAFFGYSSGIGGHRPGIFPRSRPDISDSDYLRLVGSCRAQGVGPLALGTILGLNDRDMKVLEDLYSSPPEIKALGDILNIAKYVTNDAFSAVDGHMIDEYALIDYTHSASTLEKLVFERLLMSYHLTCWALTYPVMRTYKLTIRKEY